MGLRIRNFLVILWSTVLPVMAVYGQTGFPAHGLHDNTPQVHAFTNCTLVTGPGEQIGDGVLIIRDGLVENAGSGLSVPKDALVHDLKGAWVFPGFVDAWSAYGLDKAKREPGGPGRAPQYKTKNQGPYAWNESVKPETRVAEMVRQDAKIAAEWRGIGFTTVNVVPNDGIFRGTSAVLNLRNGALKDALIATNGGAYMSFRKGVSRQSYPSSLMGAIALIRQTFLDASWYAEVQKARKTRPGMPPVETNLALEALNAQLKAGIRHFFAVENWQNVLRAARIADEFGLTFVYKTAGDAYKRIDALARLGADFIVPLKFPKAMDVKSVADAREITLERMLHWEKAPMNPGILAEKKLRFALTPAGLKGSKAFWPAIQKAVQHGLSAEDALKALTLAPAQILGLDDRLGSLEPGKYANFIICNGDLFTQKKSTIYETWVAGQRNINKPMPEWAGIGRYNLSFGGRDYGLLIGGKPAAPNAKVVTGGDTIKADFSVQGLNVTLLFGENKSKNAAKMRLSGIADGKSLAGTGEDTRGVRSSWTATYAGEYTEKSKPDNKPEPADLSGVPGTRWPNKAYGWGSLPAQETVVIQNATVWTNTGEGVLQNASVVLKNGKVDAVGTNLKAIPPGAQVIDGTGLHVTPGIIDEHSHIAVMRGVNEGSHSISAEVNIGDVVNCEDVNIYRQLAGGVTASQLLHGSANPIGGQSGLVKLRWGQLPEDMKIDGADGFIKFALGENVKQSNWGDNNVTRYPQTRLGVEQQMKDAFRNALDYKAAIRRYKNGVGSVPVRRDLQAETVLEILEGKRFVTCHSYQQGEMNMLMHLAEEFGFRINTFTHVLEGFKIADKIAKHGATASTFSDWWAYKYEVIDAIPYNAAIMTRMGVNVCINSDDAEMGRRLNQEAAKTVMYGGLSEEEALKTVTLNPAKALHLDDRMGSIAAGKDGDIVVWTDHPLSVYAKSKMTFVDGRRYYDMQRDVDMRKWIASERNRLVKKMMSSPEKGKQSPTTKPGKRLYHCETLEFETSHDHE